ncbi:MAG TPA: flavin reductase [Bacilli bacterium]|nr:MAG: hypothetical protein BWY97_01251 [Tenericutes bacterium ADurb.BinA124]HPX84857.1 flavin reductase [Bacilli bacterium]
MAKVVFIDMKESKDFQFTENLFKNLGQDYALLTAGVENDFNTMTVGWATFGVIWGKNVITCYVRPSRFTYEFMEKNDYFTLSFYDARFIAQLTYLGTHSGRNEDKVGKVGFKPLLCGESVTFEEAKVTFLCKKIYHQNLDEHQIAASIKERYYPRDDFHRFYIGEILKTFVNE